MHKHRKKILMELYGKQSMNERTQATQNRNSENEKHGEVEDGNKTQKIKNQVANLIRI